MINIESCINELNEIVSAMHDGFIVNSYDGDSLSIIGSQDHCYHHDVEIICNDVEHVDMDFRIDAQRIEIIRNGYLELSIIDVDNVVHKIISANIYVKFELVKKH